MSGGRPSSGAGSSGEGRDEVVEPPDHDHGWSAFESYRAATGSARDAEATAPQSQEIRLVSVRRRVPPRPETCA